MALFKNTYPMSNSGVGAAIWTNEKYDFESGFVGSKREFVWEMDGMRFVKAFCWFGHDSKLYIEVFVRTWY